MDLLFLNSKMSTLALNEHWQRITFSYIGGKLSFWIQNVNLHNWSNWNVQLYLQIDETKVQMFILRDELISAVFPLVPLKNSAILWKR